MQTVVTDERQAVAAYEAAALCQLSDAELDLVAAGVSHHKLAQISIGNIAIGVQINNQINIAVLSAGAMQGGSQSNFNNAGTVISYIRRI
jgi:hypothetical protein